jgi:restriction endonuclease Mrr
MLPAMKLTDLLPEIPETEQTPLRAGQTLGRRGGPAGGPEVRRGAAGPPGTQRVFITTSSFSKDVQEYVSRIDSKIVLIDGEALGQLMIEHNVGILPVAAYEVKKLDSDYFTKA